MPRCPNTAPQVLTAASDMLRASLPLPVPLLGLQSTALHVALTAMEAWGVHGSGEAARSLQEAHAMLAEDLEDLFRMAVCTQCVMDCLDDWEHWGLSPWCCCCCCCEVHCVLKHVCINRWMDGVAMLRLLDVLDAHSALLLEHHPQLLPTNAPLLLKAAAWNPHLLGQHIRRVLPLLVARDTLPQLLAYALDMPAMAAAQDGALTKEVRAGSVYAWPRWQAPHSSSVRKSMGA